MDKKMNSLLTRQRRKETEKRIHYWSSTDHFRIGRLDDQLDKGSG